MSIIESNLIIISIIAQCRTIAQNEAQTIIDKSRILSQLADAMK